MRVVVLAPDLLDRSQITGAVPDAVFVNAAALLPTASEGADVVLVDLGRAGVLDVLDAVVATAARVVGFGSHVDTEVLAAATAAGVEAMPRSRFFRDIGAAIR